MKLHIDIKLDIDSCMECPFFGGDWMVGDSCRYTGEVIGTLDPLDHHIRTKIPNWCPFIEKGDKK